MMTARKSKSWLPLIALALFLMAFGPSARSIASRQRNAVGAASSAELTRRNNNAFAMILGEFRASISDFMFMKTERYLDSGIAYAPHIQVDEPAHEEAEEHGDHEHEEAVPTVIRVKAEDFRGFLGELERTVKPYRDPKSSHQHTSGEELLPWYRMMTLANPRQARPYLIGAMWLSQQKRLDQAIEFLSEGIRKNEDNPEQFRLYTGLATAYIKMRHQEKPDPQWAHNALAAAREGFERGLKQRIRLIGGGPVETFKGAWREDFEEELRQAGLYVALLEDELGNKPAAIDAARRTQAFAPNFAPIRRMLENQNTDS